MDDKEEAVREAIQKLEKAYGKGVVLRMDDAPLKIEAIPTGSIALDRATGIGGVPRGRITEIYGRPGTGKSSLIQHIIAEAQGTGEVCALIDAEHSLDAKYAQACGVQMDRLYICQPDDGEQGLEVAEGLIRSGGVAVVAVDSVASMVPRAELEGEMSDQQMGLQARLMGKALRKLGGLVCKSGVALCFTNQLREKIGGYSPTGQAVEITPGGRALGFHASLRLHMKKVEDIKDGRETIGVRTKAVVAKNKCAPPLKEAILDILYGLGICKATGLLDVGVEVGTIKKSGAFYTFQETRWHGRDSAILALRNDAELMAAIDKEIRAQS